MGASYVLSTRIGVYKKVYQKTRLPARQVLFDEAERIAKKEKGRPLPQVRERERGRDGEQQSCM
jgi:hypothetical protein